MAEKNKTSQPVKKGAGTEKPASFNPADLTVEQQETVVEYYMGYHPRYFLYDGLQIKMNIGRFENDERRLEKEEGKPRRWFNGWNQKPRNMRIKNAKEREGREL